MAKRLRKHMLNGRTALVVEEEFLIALDVQRMLEALGVGLTLFARTPAEAEQLRARWPEIAIAILAELTALRHGIDLNARLTAEQGSQS